MTDTCGHGDVDTSQVMWRWVACHDRALFEAQSTENHASGYRPTAMCSRHAEYARRHWHLLYVRTLTSAKQERMSCD